MLILVALCFSFSGFPLFLTQPATYSALGHSLQDHYKALGQTVADTKLEHVRAQMAAFKQGLEGFALKHRQVHVGTLICTT